MAPDYSPPPGDIKVISGNGQLGTANIVLPDTIVIAVTPKNIGDTKYYSYYFESPYGPMEPSHLLITSSAVFTISARYGSCPTAINQRPPPSIFWEIGKFFHILNLFNNICHKLYFYRL